MPVGKDSRVAQLIEAFKEWVPSARMRFVEWAEACREQPILIWHTRAVRYGVYALGLILAAVLVASFVDWWAPPQVQERARTADFQVICNDPACGKRFVINREFGFSKFPVKCPECGKKTGQLALRCHSDTCRGTWVIPREVDDHYRCPRCGALLGPAD